MADSPAWATAKQPAQEAPFLTHLSRHHGQITLTAPPNQGRRRQPDEPAASTSDTPEVKVKKKKKKKAKKRRVDSEIFDAVVNAGRTTPTPPSNGEGAGQEAPSMERASSSGLGAELAGMRGSSAEGGRTGSASLRPAVAEEVVALRARYNRGSVFDNLDELGDDLPPFATQHHSSSTTYAPGAEPLPSSPPPAYPACSRSPSPISPLDQTFATPPESSTSPESPILPPAELLPVDDPFVLAWETDRSAGLSLDERIERDLARRLRSATSPSASQPLPPPPLPLPGAPSPPPPPSTSTLPTLSASDVDQAERREIAEAEADQDASRVARALSVRAGRRFSEAADRRRERETRTRLPDIMDEVEVVDHSAASVPVRTAVAQPTGSPAPLGSPAIAAMERRAVEAEEEGEESESDEEESAPARLARAVSANASRHFAEAAERRIALERAQRLVPIAEAPRPPSPLSTLPSPPTPEPQVDQPSPSLFTPRPFGLTSSPRQFGLAEASRPSSAPPSEAPRPPPLAPRPSASSRLASTSTSTFPPPPPTPETPTPLLPSENREDLAGKGKARATDDSEVAEPPPPRRSAPPPPPSRLSSVFPGAYPPPEGPPPPLARRQPTSRTSSLPPEPNPSILSYLSQQERDGLADPLEPDPSPTTPVARIPGRFPSLRRPAPPPPPSRPPPPRPPPPPPSLIPVASTPPLRRQRRPLPIPPGPSDRIDAHTVLREQAAAAERAAFLAERQAATTQSDHLAVDAEVGAGIPPRPPSTTSSVEVPLPSEPGEDVEPSQALEARSARDDFVYTDLDLLLARLEDNNASNYDELLLVGEVLGPAQAVASSLADIESLDVARVELVRRRIDKQGRVKQKLSVVGVRCVDCIVCLARFRVDEFAVVLPRCLHVFHAECLTKWLLRSQQCPVCRTDAFEPRIVDI